MRPALSLLLKIGGQNIYYFSANLIYNLLWDPQILDFAWPSRLPYVIKAIKINLSIVL